MKTFLHKIHFLRILTIAAIAFVSGLLLLLLLLASLPALISTHAVQVRIQNSLSSSMKRQVVWSSLAMGWFDGLTLTGLKLGNGPAPLLKTEIDQLVIIPSVGRDTDGRTGINLVIRVKNARMELAPGSAEPETPSTKDPLTQLAETIQLIQGLDYLLPMDFRVMVDVAPLQVLYCAPAPEKPVLLHGFSFRFAMPSLASKPITAAVKGEVSLDGRDAGGVNLNATVSDLVNNKQRINLASALFAVDASAPGTSIALSGRLSQGDGFVARWKFDLPRMLAVVHPFISSTVPQFQGMVDLQLRAQADAQRDLHATLTIDGTQLAASGGSLQAKQVGPLDLKLRQQIVTDHVRQRVGFPSGALVIPTLIDAAWNVSVSNPTLPSRSVQLQFGPARLDLGRTLFLAAPFLPPDATYKDLAGEVSVRSLDLKLNGPGNSGTLAISDFGASFPRLRLGEKNGEFTAEDVNLLFEKVECPLVRKLPTRFTADLLWNIRRGAFSGATPFAVQGARGKFGLMVTDLNLKSSSPRKVAASATLNQSMDFDRASFGTQFTILKAHDQLRLLARASETGDIEASLPEFAVTVASLQGSKSGKQFGPVPLSASLTAAGVHLPAEKGGGATLQRAAATIAAGDFLQLAAEAALSGGSPARVTSSGNARLNLGRALPFSAPFLPSGLKADGILSAVWNLAAPLQAKVAVAENHPLRSARAGLSQFDTLDLAVKLDNISALIPSAKGGIKVAGLRTRPDVRFVSTKNGESATLEGGILFSALSGLPGTTANIPPQHGSFAFNGELSGWRDLRLFEELHLDPLALSHEAELNVSRIDTLLDEKEPFSSATVIKRLDATLFANIDGAFSRELKQLFPGIDVAGALSSSTRVDLIAGRELALRSALKSKDFSIQLANGTMVEGVRSNVTVARNYSLTAASPGGGWTPLSTALVKPDSPGIGNPGAAEIAGRIHNDLRGDVSGARSFSIRSVTTKGGGVPLVLTSLEGDLLFTQEKTGVSFFQADLLGGTLLARGVFDLLPEVPNVAASSSFSNLDITNLLPKESRKIQTDHDTEITGEISLTAPLTPEQRELFEQLRLSLNVRKIGAHTIERALFSLDPYERNEQVVSQRKMLKMGGLKGLRATAVDGAFSMEGEAQIKGVAVELPKVERLRISELPLRQDLINSRKGITALRGFLDLVRADTLVVGQKGELSLKRRVYAQ